MSEGTKKPLSLPGLLGSDGAGICRAVEAARSYLCGRDTAELLRDVGKTIESVPPSAHMDKRFIQASYAKASDDLLTGLGLFYLTEQRKLFLDCTAGHYQMTWGYNHPALNEALCEAVRAGVVWDDHSNIPGDPIKRLAARLVEAAGGGEGLNTAHLGMCTGSCAASTAIKIALKHHEAARPDARPVFIAIEGNYHGTDFFAQRLRGMWGNYFAGADFVQVEPNDLPALQQAFRQYRGRVAAFFAEPILMNREAILLEREYLRAARLLCDEAGACMVIDEIQTCFWQPEVFMFLQYDIVPDMLVVGKGMTAGFHPLAALLFRRRLDLLEQYDAINTNGNAPLAAIMALCCLSLIERDRDRIADMSRYYYERLKELPAKHPDRVAAIHGKGLLAGVKFRAVQDALAFHQRCMERGLWVRAHAYHEGHSTVLTKLGLPADRAIADFVVESFLAILREMRT